MNYTNTSNLLAAVAGAIAILAATSPAGRAETASGMEKCYGISKAGENSCANQAGTHSCAGQSKADYDGQEWRAVKSGVCMELGGKLEPFSGANEAKKKG